jgi:hypothetical protein
MRPFEFLPFEQREACDQGLIPQNHCKQGLQLPQSVNFQGFETHHTLFFAE